MAVVVWWGDDDDDDDAHIQKYIQII